VLGAVLVEEVTRIEKQELQTTAVATKLNKQLQLALETIVEQKRRLHEQTNRSDRALQYQLAPDYAPQERIHSILPWLNRYGLNLVQTLRMQYEQTEAEQLKIML
jgi:uncharacterized protein YllA (UPF0747 family)